MQLFKMCIYFQLRFLDLSICKDKNVRLKQYIKVITVVLQQVSAYKPKKQLFKLLLSEIIFNIFTWLKMTIGIQSSFHFGCISVRNINVYGLFFTRILKILERVFHLWEAFYGRILNPKHITHSQGDEFLKQHTHALTFI